MKTENQESRDVPILFKGEMVRAILPRRKTQTRRLKINWKPGDRLWVRETWKTDRNTLGMKGIRFRADGQFLPLENPAENVTRWHELNYKNPEGVWKSPLFCEKWFSRIWLRVMEVRQENLQDISEEDAIAEGAECPIGIIPIIINAGVSYRNGFARLWDSINDKRGFGWDTNPKVWVTKFEVEEIK